MGVVFDLGWKGGWRWTWKKRKQNFFTYKNNTFIWNVLKKKGEPGERGTKGEIGVGEKVRNKYYPRFIRWNKLVLTYF